jgi:isoleucyl-tRNA synthetase
VRPNFRRLGPRLGKKMPLAKNVFEQIDGARLSAQLLDRGSAQIELDGEILSLDPEDVEVLVEAAQHFAAAGDRSTVVVLNTALDDQLREEGLYRELLHRVQNLRKELNVDYTERIRVAVQGSDRVQRIVSSHRDHFQGETLCVDLQAGKPSWDRAEHRQFDVDGEEVTIVLGRL